MENKVFGKGETVFREGEMGNCFYEIKEGLAGVYLHYGEADQRKLTDMKPGQYFGEMAAIEAWPRSTTIVAEEELHVTEISEKELNDFFSEQPDRIFALMKQLGGRIRELSAEYEEVKAFVSEKKKAGAAKKEGFLTRLKEYLEISALADKNAGATMEQVMEQKVAVKEGAVQPVSTYNKGEIIFREGDPGLYMYAIHYGTVGIYVNYGTDKEKKLTVLYPNTFFGEMGMIENEPRSATAVVEEDNTVLEFIRAEDLEGLFKKNPAKVDMILTHLSHRLRALTKDYIKACREAIQDT